MYTERRRKRGIDVDVYFSFALSSINTQRVGQRQALLHHAASAAIPAAGEQQQQQQRRSSSRRNTHKRFQRSMQRVEEFRYYCDKFCFSTSFKHSFSKERYIRLYDAYQSHLCRLDFLSRLKRMYSISLIYFSTHVRIHI